MFLLVPLLTWLSLINAQNLPITRPNYLTHECKRPCNGVAKRCYYKIYVEAWYTMVPNCLRCLNGTAANCDNPECIVADARQRYMLTFNRMMPGPSIEVCQNDEIMIDVENDLVDIDTTMHFHGIHQKQTPWMDGVPMVTQCPITAETTFRYHFLATEAGTHWYHSHSSSQRADGLYGPLIVRQTPQTNIHASQYDFDLSDHVITVQDWYRLPPFEHFYSNIRLKAFNWDMIVAVLINGRGTTSTNKIPPKVFNVKRGSRYRFRVIHAGGEPCPMELTIEGHTMTVISSDTGDIKPFTVSKLLLGNGERFDFVLNANQNVNTYAIRLTGGIICNNLQAYAQLKYEGSGTRNFNYSGVNFPPATAMTGNCINKANSANCVNYNNMTNMRAPPSGIGNFPDYIYYWGFDIYEFAKRELRGAGDEGLSAALLNNISHVPPSSPLLATPNVDSDKFCNAEVRPPKYCYEGVCECVHMIEIPQNWLVEFIFVDEARLIELLHPFHLHGSDFYVVAHEKLGTSISTTEVRRLNEQGRIKKNFVNPIAKDTVSVPSGGYTVVRFFTTNPGTWFLHCHIDFHSEEGMAAVVRIGNTNTKFNIPANFPKCGNYLQNNTLIKP